MCRNGGYTECGIKHRHGFARERWRIEPEFAVRLDPALAAIRCPAGADQRGGQGVGTHRPYRTAGLLGAAYGPGHRGRPDRPAGGAAGVPARPRRARARPGDGAGPSPSWSAGWALPTTPGRCVDIGLAPDIVLECTGADPVIVGRSLDVAARRCRLPHRRLHRRPSADSLDIGQANRDVRAGEQRGLRHRSTPTSGTGRRRPTRWRRPTRTGLSALVTRRVPLTGFADALTARPDDVKVILDLTV